MVVQLFVRVQLYLPPLHLAWTLQTNVELRSINSASGIGFHLAVLIGRYRGSMWDKQKELSA